MKGKIKERGGEVGNKVLVLSWKKREKRKGSHSRSETLERKGGWRDRRKKSGDTRAKNSFLVRRGVNKTRGS